MTPHPSHPGWYHPPVPLAPVLCERCGTASDDDAGAEPCPGPRDPADRARPYADAPSITETHAAAWRQHEEAHR